MHNRAFPLVIVIGLVAVLLAAAPLVAKADVELREVDWHTLPGTGTVQFHLQWYNPDPAAPSLSVSGEARAQQFGVFVTNEGLIGTFNVPPIEPESFFDIFYEVDLGSLPPPPPEGYSAKPLGGPPAIPCPPGDHWDGNIDIQWGGPGGIGHVNYHIGQIMVCPGMGLSHIHMIVGCAVAAPWAINGVCQGWSASLLNEDLTLAPNPVPAFWTGWITIGANAQVPIGQVCCMNFVFTCGAQTGTVRICAIACQCQEIGTDPSTWGQVKTIFR